MVTRERGHAARPAPQAGERRAPDWKIPRGSNMGEVARDATGQVMNKYSEALKKLRNH